MTPNQEMLDGSSIKEINPALDMLLDSGYLVLERVLPSALVQTLRCEYDRLFEAERKDKTTQRIQRSHSGNGHLQMQIPLVEPFSNPIVVANPAVIGILEQILGDNLKCAYYNSHVSLPGSTCQEVHRDDELLFGSQLSVATPPLMFTVNLPLEDFTEKNGSTEVWPSSHLITDRTEEQSSSSALTRRATSMTGTRLNVTTGSIIIRDRRLWHRGMPNFTDRIRPMLSLVYKRAWLGWRHNSVVVPECTFNAWPQGVRKLFTL